MKIKNKKNRVFFSIILLFLTIAIGTSITPKNNVAHAYDLIGNWIREYKIDQLKELSDDITTGKTPMAEKDGYKLFNTRKDGNNRDMIGPDGKEINPDSEEYKARYQELYDMGMQNLNDLAAKIKGTGDEISKNLECPPNPNIYSAPICWLGNKIQSIVFGAIYLILAAAVLLVSLIGNLATMLFVHMINGSIVTGVLNNHIVYDLWTSVRDLLNIVFIIALLYSAFSTIFGIESFHAKSVVKKVIIAAFLVNFSFPIARFIVDFFNYFMYYLVGVLGFDDPRANSLFGDSGPIKQVSKLALTVNKEYITKENLAMAMMAIVFIFIFSTTLLIIAFLFIIRTIVLALLIIFSPIAFVGPLLPFTATYAKQWWQKLFQYCMFGPIMMFMLYMATQFAIALSDLNMSPAEAGGGSEGGLIATIALFSMPLVVLWAGMGIAQGSSIAFAGAVQSKATSAMKFATYGGAWKGTKWAAKKTGIPGGVQQKYDQWKKTGWLGTERTAQRSARVAAALKVPGSIERDAQTRSEEYKKSHATEKELKEKAEKGDAAAGLRLAEDGNIEHKQYEALMTIHKDDEGLKKLLTSKTAGKRADVVIDYKMKNEGEARAAKLANGSPITDAIRREAKLQIAKEEYGKIAPGKIKEQNIAALAGYDTTTQAKKVDENGKLIEADEIRREAMIATHMVHLKSGNIKKVAEDMDANKFAAARKTGVL